MEKAASLEEINLITQKIIGCAFKVSNTLGSGFLEKVYENALAYELQKAGLTAEQQHPIDVIYYGVNVGQYFADILVENMIMVELKTVKKIDDIHMAQCLNYLNATACPLCLLMNFHSTKVEIHRIAGNALPISK